jgi:hypothetical protein
VALPAVVDASAEAGIADQFLGSGEAGHIANGREHGHGGEQAEAGELDEIGDIVLPGGVGAQAVQFRFDLGQMLLDVIQGSQVV